MHNTIIQSKKPLNQQESKFIILKNSASPMLPFALNRDQTFSNCWKDLPFGFKFLFVFILGYNTLSLFLSFLYTKVSFQGFLVAHQLQFYRIFFTYLTGGEMPGAIFNILINFLWFLPIIPALERKYSTSYILVEMFIQNLMINLILTLLSVIIHDVFSVYPDTFVIYNLGLFPLCQIFIWHKTAQSPDEHTTFCCMPCLIPMKWVPILILVISIVLTSILFPALVVASLLGYLQFMHFKRRFIKLPVRFYRRIDTLLPKSVTDRPDYVKVQNVEASLQSQAYVNAVNHGGANPFQRNHNVIEEVAPAKVEVFGKGVSIGGGNSGNAQNFRGVWAQKGDDIEIEPTPVHQQVPKKGHGHQIDPQFFNSNDSNMRFNDNAGSEEQSEDGLEQKDEKKVAKQNLLQ